MDNATLWLDIEGNTGLGSSSAASLYTKLCHPWMMVLSVLLDLVFLFCILLSCHRKKNGWQTFAKSARQANRQSLFSCGRGLPVSLPPSAFHLRLHLSAEESPNFSSKLHVEPKGGTGGFLINQFKDKLFIYFSCILLFLHSLLS